LIETRSSPAVNAVLKDFIAGQFEICFPVISIVATCKGVTLIERQGALAVQVNFEATVTNGGTVDFAEMTLSRSGTTLATVSLAQGASYTFVGSYIPSQLPSGSTIVFTDTFKAVGDAKIPSVAVVSAETSTQCPLCP
jgi:hypothetical protein